MSTCSLPKNTKKKCSCYVLVEENSCTVPTLARSMCSTPAQLPLQQTLLLAKDKLANTLAFPLNFCTSMTFMF